MTFPQHASPASDQARHAAAGEPCGCLAPGSPGSWLLAKVLAPPGCPSAPLLGAVASLYGYKGARIAPDAGLDTILAGAARGRADCRTAQLPLVGDSPIGEP